MDSLVSTQWLAGHLGEPDLVVVDASWHMPASGRSGHDEYLKAHIPGARFLDIDEVSDKSNPAPHMLPDAAEFGRAMEQLGIGSDDRIVVYDNSPTRNAARGWFMLRHFGAHQVAILDGGFQKWLAEGRPTESGEPEPRQAGSLRRSAAARSLRSRTSSPASKRRCSMLAAKLASKAPRPTRAPGVAAGHIPGARNLPFGSLYNEDGTSNRPKR